MTMQRQPFVVLLALAGIILFPIAAQAQSYAVDKGSILTGGDAGLVSEDNDGETSGSRTVTLQLSPSLQYTVLPGLALGGDVSFTRTWYGGDGALVTYSVGPTATYYFGRGARTFYPYISAGGGYTRLNYDWADAADASGRSLRASGGILFMLSKGVGVSGELYHSRSSFGGGDFRSNSYGLAFGVSAFVF